MNGTYFQGTDLGYAKGLTWDMFASWDEDTQFPIDLAKPFI